MDAVTHLAPTVGVVAACDFLGVAQLSHFEAHCSLFSSLTPPRSALQGHRDRLL
jgi:hypothetical protein